MDWVGKTKKKVGAKGHTDYDAKVTVVSNGTKAEPNKTALSIVFRNKAYGIALALDAKTVKRSMILPNSDKFYFMFESEDKDNIGVKLSKPPRGNAMTYRARFPFMSKAEAQIVERVWIGEYSIEYDKEEGAHYIERKSSK